MTNQDVFQRQKHNRVKKVVVQRLALASMKGIPESVVIDH